MKLKFIEVEDRTLSVQVNRATCSSGEPQPKTMNLISFDADEDEANTIVHYLTIETAEQLINELRRGVRELEHEQLMGEWL